MDRRIAVGGAVVAVIALLLLGLLIAQDTDIVPPPDVVPEPVVRPAGPTAPAPVPVATRQTLSRPEGVPAEDFPDEPPPPAVVTPEDKRAMNYAVDDVLTAAREECILPWIDGIDTPTEAEFVFDAVLWNGRLYDVGIRSLNLEIPPKVTDCMADKAWYTEWPTWEIPGELRLQRQISYRNAAMMPR